mmetsp:Transcript_68340/g.108443  ORF Transcript_68340/g.108443 Transcript_68340/m.108443 type:complete len:250 (-) Transcript_68340:433-1182(-)
MLCVPSLPMQASTLLRNAEDFNTRVTQLSCQNSFNNTFVFFDFEVHASKTTPTRLQQQRTKSFFVGGCCDSKYFLGFKIWLRITFVGGCWESKHFLGLRFRFRITFSTMFGCPCQTECINHPKASTHGALFGIVVPHQQLSFDSVLKFERCDHVPLRSILSLINIKGRRFALAILHIQPCILGKIPRASVLATWVIFFKLVAAAYRHIHFERVAGLPFIPSPIVVELPIPCIYHAWCVRSLERILQKRL